MKKKIPELLAPAGGMNQLVAAVENGANAVYLGGPLFNARIQADNFTEEKLEQAVDYAHLRDVKVHVTLNTLLKDEELLPALEYAAKLYEMGVDALIVQDLGLAYLLRQYLPDLPLHLSTQGSIYNLSGVKKASWQGNCLWQKFKKLQITLVAKWKFLSTERYAFATPDSVR